METFSPLPINSIQRRLVGWLVVAGRDGVMKEGEGERDERGRIYDLDSENRNDFGKTTVFGLYWGRNGGGLDQNMG